MQSIQKDQTPPGLRTTSVLCVHVPDKTIFRNKDNKNKSGLLYTQ